MEETAAQPESGKRQGDPIEGLKTALDLLYITLELEERLMAGRVGLNHVEKTREIDALKAKIYSKEPQDIESLERECVRIGAKIIEDIKNASALELTLDSMHFKRYLDIHKESTEKVWEKTSNLKKDVEEELKELNDVDPQDKKWLSEIESVIKALPKQTPSLEKMIKEAPELAENLSAAVAALRETAEKEHATVDALVSGGVVIVDSMQKIATELANAIKVRQNFWYIMGTVNAMHNGLFYHWKAIRLAKKKIATPEERFLKDRKIRLLIEMAGLVARKDRLFEQIQKTSGVGCMHFLFDEEPKLPEKVDKGIDLLTEKINSIGQSLTELECALCTGDAERQQEKLDIISAEIEEAGKILNDLAKDAEKSAKRTIELIVRQTKGALQRIRSEREKGTKLLKDFAYLKRLITFIEMDTYKEMIIDDVKTICRITGGSFNAFIKKIDRLERALKNELSKQKVDKKSLSEIAHNRRYASLLKECFEASQMDQLLDSQSDTALVHALPTYIEEINARFNEFNQTGVNIAIAIRSVILFVLRLICPALPFMLAAYALAWLDGAAQTEHRIWEVFVPLTVSATLGALSVLTDLLGSKSLRRYRAKLNTGLLLPVLLIGLRSGKAVSGIFWILSACICAMVYPGTVIWTAKVVMEESFDQSKVEEYLKRAGTFFHRISLQLLIPVICYPIWQYLLTGQTSQDAQKNSIAIITALLYALEVCRSHGKFKITALAGKTLFLLTIIPVIINFYQLQTLNSVLKEVDSHYQKDSV